MKKKLIKYLLSIVLCFLIVSIGVTIVSAQEWPAYNVCCEKTENGAWCQNANEEDCAEGFRTTPTSCDATSFCKMGCCVDTEEGLCMENTPEKVCEISTGTWMEDAECNVPQCNLGCCVLGDQASFVTLTRCKKLSGFYGLETNFQNNINDEASCIILAHAQDRGACVFETESTRTCKLTTRSGCSSLNAGNVSGEPEFYKDFLCSADELGTNCGPTTDTLCIPGKDEVYFKDSCGNPTNIYDAKKIYSQVPSYWQKLVGKAESCGYDEVDGNAGSRGCGNCDYFSGSICSEGNPTYGDYICKDLNCYNTDNGKDYKNGESWCVDQSNVGEGRDVVGSRHFRHICINGEEVVEACADFRNEICIENVLETSSGRFIESGCRVNRWKDCIDQDEEDDCLNTDQRDCFWLEGMHYSTGDESRTLDDGRQDISFGIKNGGGICLPNNPPGLQFWNEGDASNICSLANTRQTVTYEKGLIGSKKCEGNCEAITPAWARKMNNICLSVGDCGGYVNIAGKMSSKGVEWKINGKKQVVSGILDNVKSFAGVRG
ncbi:hypothetical protein HOD75_04885 [archaeon]|jgi:hypothetical protein|nr:hypothetical protein [archaeon]MBT4242200.1 hypothetical protein [archaeon]MBT4417888.1 hypothetical protein [archaeon]